MRLGMAIVRLLAVFAAVVAAVPAAASERPGIVQYNEAADRFDRLLAAGAAKGTLPRASDPEVAALLRRLTDPKAVFGDGPIALEDFPALIAVVNRTIGLSSVYAEFGVNPAANETELARHSDRNMIEYQNEVVPLMAFMVDGSATLATGIEDNLRGQQGPLADHQRSGALKVRQGLHDIAMAMIMISTTRGLTPEHRLAAIEAVSRNGSVISRALTLSQRRALMSHVRSGRQGAGPKAVKELDGFLAMLGALTCEGLCSL